MDERFRVATTNPHLKDKIKINIEDLDKPIYWYIKFNVPLDKPSVTNHTMSVMDTDGYLMRTYIAYDPGRDLIVVSPLDTYLENKYYILTISTDVRSAKGNNLKKEIYIMFMLINNQVSKFQILKNTSGIPSQKPRPTNYDQLIDKRKPNHSITAAAEASATAERVLVSGNLPYQDIKVNTSLVLTGAAVAGIGFGVGLNWMFLMGAALFALGFLIISRQIYQTRAKFYYNIGAYHFNKRAYPKALVSIQKSHDIAADDMSLSALRTVRKYVSHHFDSERTDE